MELTFGPLDCNLYTIPTELFCLNCRWFKSQEFIFNTFVFLEKLSSKFDNVIVP